MLLMFVYSLLCVLHGLSILLPPLFPFPSITNQMAAPLPEHGPAGGFFLLNVLPSHFHQVHSHRGPFHCYVLSLLLYCVYFTTRSECFLLNADRIESKL